ncbi:MAG: BamA/TamA family outer membrane protein [Bacteroidetes bacterium]|nr:BamA/TamA family outer membrane protein [Bacteroidota bacterium]
MKNKLSIVLLFSFFLIAPGGLHAQQADSTAHNSVPGSDTVKSKPEKDCKQQAIGDLFKKKEKAPKPPKKFMALILPNISSNPSNGFVLGVGGTFGWYMGPKENTRVSSAPFTLAVTSKKQLISFVKSNIFTKEDKFFLQGDWRFYLYSQPTYGLGTNAPDTANLPNNFHWDGQGGSTDSVSFPMKYNYLKFSEIVNRKIVENFYVGIGYHFDYYYSIDDEKLRLNPDTLLTPHYVYSRKFNYDTTQYMMSGLSANVVFDSRDNQANPYKGIYANINYRYNFKFLGSDKDASELWTEFRTYVGLSKKRARHMIAFWVFGDFNLTGNLPYMTLPALGGDQRARSGRGYVNGRFRGKNLVYGEVEWRFPISPCSQILGGVIFVNATTTDNPARDVALFQYVKPAVGFGLRVMINKYFRTNINLDFAIGSKSQGFYFSGQETF